MRSKKAILNTVASLMLEVFAIFNGLIVPRLILSTFGSSYNGIISSITQFLGYASLLTAGVGGVTRAALYKPLAENNKRVISAIVKATEKFLRKVSFIFIGALVIFASFYPFIKSVTQDENQFSWFFTFTLVMIIGISTFFQYFFGLTYSTVLSADQKQYIDSFIRIVTTVINTILAVILIKVGAGIHLIRLGSSLIYLLNPLAIHFYVKRKYGIIKDSEPDNSAIKQKWDAFGHQIAHFVHANTDLVILSFFSTLKEISVYTVYNFVNIGVRTAVTSTFKGIDSAFGNMIAKNEKELLIKNFSMFEFLMHSISIVLFVCMAILITPFVLVYTKGITDINYNRLIFGYLFALTGFLYCVRIPCQTIAEAAGHFKQTRNGALLEAILNISISLVLIKPLGINGIMIGTMVAMFFRTIQYTWYVYRNIINQSLLPVLYRYLATVLNIVVIIGIVYFINLPTPKNYLTWTTNGVIVFLISFVVTFIFSLVFARKDLINFIEILKNLLRQYHNIIPRIKNKNPR